MTKGKVNAHVSHAAPTETLSGPPGDLPRHLVRRASGGGGVTGLQAAVHLAAPGAGQGGGVLYIYETRIGKDRLLYVSPDTVYGA